MEDLFGSELGPNWIEVRVRRSEVEIDYNAMSVE